MTQDFTSQSMNQRLNYVKGKFHTQNINLNSYEPRQVQFALLSFPFAKEHGLHATYE